MSSIKIGILVNSFIVRKLLIQVFVIAVYEGKDIIKKYYTKRWIHLSTK